MNEAASSDGIEPTAPRRRLLGAATVYFLIVFGAGLLMGPLRVLWLEPVLGPFLAVLCEAPLLILAMWIAAGVAPRVAGLDAGLSAHFVLGVLALMFQLVADVAVGFGLRGMVLQDQLAYFGTPAGWVYVVSLVVFALMPAFRRWRAVS
ncbi:MAG: hypothetical protein AB7H66_05995 [Hyphomonadaceae bacterium]